MMRKIISTLVVVMAFVLNASAQKTVTGVVTDANGKPLPNVSVIVKGTNVGTSTKADGSYNLPVPANARTIIYSSVDMQSEEVNIGSRTSINTTLVAGDRALQEVIVTGYTREKKSQFTGSATVLGSKVVENVPVGAFDQALQGRAPGLLVNSSSGQPGTSANLTIRGVQSIVGANVQPLFIVDGVPLPAADMATINANDFESITVLKDAGAAALYGARGGLGVIVITTKKGRAGVTNVTFRSQLGFTQAPSSTNFDVMNTQEILSYEERLKLTGTPGWEYSKLNPTYATASATVKARRDFLLDSIGKIDSDYSQYLFRQGISQTHELNVSGGSDKSRFFLSAAYMDQKGLDINSELKRYTTRFNFDHTAGKFNIQFNTAAGYSISTYSEGEWNAANGAQNNFAMLWRSKPYENPYGADGKLIFGTSTNLNPKQVGNLIEQSQNSVLRQNQIKINSGITVNYKLFPNVNLRNTLGIDVSDDRWQRAINANSYWGSRQTNGAGLDAEATKITANTINTTSAVFNKRFNKIHDVEVGAYFEVVRGYQKALGFSLTNMDPRLTQTGQGAGTIPVGALTAYPQNASSAKSQYGIRSYFATGRYTYKDKYTITGNVRQDATSRILNEDNKEILTWSAGASWNAIQENFLKKQKVLSDLRLRASYGIVPNIGSIATNNYTISGGLVTVSNYLGPQVPSYGTTTGFTGSTITGIVPTTPGNPNLKIETIQKLNIGAELGFWRNRIRATVDVYKNKTVDLFVSQPLPASSGFPSLNVNAGTMENKGVELTLNIDVIRTKQFDLSFGFNHAINKNTITDLGLVNEYPLGTFVIRKGLPYGSHYTTKYLGADPTTGRPRFLKLDGTETLNPTEAPLFADFGTYLPKHVGGFNMDVRYGPFTLSALFSYQFDVVRSNNIENFITRGIAGYQSSVNGSRRLLTEQWQNPGDVKFYQNPIYDRGFSSSDLQDAKFLRFRNLNLAYQLPMINDGKGSKIIKGARFYVQMQNIAIWSPWRGPDPEDGNNISLGEYPNPRIVVTGIEINF